jgi:hypothetical protein
MLAMYLKYPNAELTPTTSVTSTVISPVKMLIERKSLTNLHSEMIFLQGKPVFFYIFLPSTLAEAKVGHVTSSAFPSFSGFIISLRNLCEILILAPCYLNLEFLVFSIYI